jgi:hypothetical protein
MQSRKIQNLHPEPLFCGQLPGAQGGTSHFTTKGQCFTRTSAAANLSRQQPEPCVLEVTRRTAGNSEAQVIATGLVFGTLVQNLLER